MPLRTVLPVIAAISGFVGSNAQAAIREIQVDAIEEFAGGMEFGKAGSYVRIRGIAKGELDPRAPENAVIADLDRAPRNDRGMVPYETDFFMLRPADPRKGSGILFYEVTNRGRKLLPAWIDEVPPASPGPLNDPERSHETGLGFSLGRGYTIVWSGWDATVPVSRNNLSIRVPIATDRGRPIIRRIRQEIEIASREADVESMRLPYPAASQDKTQARLAVRDRQNDPPTDLAPTAWEFVDALSIRLLPSGAKFAPLKIYDLWYPATQPKIVGIGFAATRDLISFLRFELADQHGTRNPALPQVASGTDGAPRYALMFGISLGGRFIRHYLELGMNKDEHGRRIFDGALAHISGIGKTFANESFAMPGRTATQHHDKFYPENWFPFSAAVTTDPFTGRSGSLLKGDGSDPLLIETNTSTEYWQKGASLLHIDASADHDLQLPAGVRVYLIAGTQHGGRARLSPHRELCANPHNPHSAAPALRALIVALEEWVAASVAPPPSRVPTLREATAVKASAVKMPDMKGFTSHPGANSIQPPVDWVNPPGRVDRHYAIRVSAVDNDGNEVAGIRLPPIAVPIATYTGWNVFAAAPGELCDRDGSYWPFARTRAERDATGDPRLSIEERYGDSKRYVEKVRAAAEALVAERLLLPADAEAYIRAARASDRF